MAAHLYVVRPDEPSEAVTGRQVALEIVALLEDRLPHVASADPVLPHLRNLLGLLGASARKPLGPGSGQRV